MVNEADGHGGEPLRVFLTAGGQEVDLNCCFLAEGKGYYYCRRDLDGAELVSCEECTASTVFLNRNRNSRLLNELV
ncbi:MAG: hypothetical protein ACFFD4_16540 [Candidatus Odinarchaeota archaeon]